MVNQPAGNDDVRWLRMIRMCSSVDVDVCHRVEGNGVER